MTSRPMLAGLFALGLILAVGLHAASPEITVYKTATCGCCGKWITHLKENGFQVTVHEVPSTDPYRKKFGVPEDLGSCHTAVVAGYSIEGHVPAADIQRLLKERPKAKGLAAPGMPMGSPGMEAPGVSANYSVLLFQEDGSTSVYQEHRSTPAPASR